MNLLHSTLRWRLPCGRLRKLSTSTSSLRPKKSALLMVGVALTGASGVFSVLGRHQSTIVPGRLLEGSTGTA